MDNRTQGNGGGAAVAIVAIVVLLILAALFFVYGIPAMQNAGEDGSSQDIQIQIPNPIQPTDEGTEPAAE